MKWLNDFKVAVIEENAEKIEELIDKIPSFNDESSAKEALALIHEAISIVNAQKLKALDSMNKICQTKAFLNSH